MPLPLPVSVTDHPAGDIYQNITRNVINNLVSKNLGMTEAEISRLTDDEICHVLATNSDKIQTPNDEINRLIQAEWDRLPEADHYRIIKAQISTYPFPFNAIMHFVLSDVDQGHALIIPHLPDLSNIIKIAGISIYLFYLFCLIISQLTKWVKDLNKRLSDVYVTDIPPQWVEDLNKRLSYSKCHVYVTDIPPKDRLKFITLSNYLETSVENLKGLKDIGKYHKGITQLMIDPKSL